MPYYINHLPLQCYSHPTNFISTRKSKMAPNNTLIPIHTAPADNRPLKRHHTARYYAHRVRESLATRLSKLLCSIFLGLLLFVGIIAFILWLSLRPHRPRFHMKSFTLTGLNQENGLENARINFELSIRNSNHRVGIYYDETAGTVYYEERSIGVTPILYPFYQPSKNTTWIHGELSGASLDVNSDRWTRFTNDLKRGKILFRLDLTSKIRFKLSTWDSKRHRMHASCLVEVGPDGMILDTSKDKRCPVYFS